MVPGAEAEYPAQPPPRHSVGQRVHVYRHVAFQKALKRRGRARKFGVLPRQQTALAERNNLLVQELFAAAQAILHRRVGADQEQRPLREVIQQAGRLRVDQPDIAIQKMQSGAGGRLLRPRGGDRSRLLGECPARLVAPGGFALGGDGSRQPFQPGGIGQHLARREQLRLIDGAGHALCFGIEQPHGRSISSPNSSTRSGYEPARSSPSSSI